MYSCEIRCLNTKYKQNTRTMLQNHKINDLKMTLIANAIQNKSVSDSISHSDIGKTEYIGRHFPLLTDGNETRLLITCKPG
jgi:hypothetical protein